jgi:hypothetical protein
MDDLELDIIEMEMEFQDIMEEWKQEDRKKPDWWLIALGAKDAPRASYEKSCDIYRRFKSFSFLHTGKEFFEIVDLFTAAMIQNRLSGDFKK